MGECSEVLEACKRIDKQIGQIIRGTSARQTLNIVVTYDSKAKNTVIDIHPEFGNKQLKRGVSYQKLQSAINELCQESEMQNIISTACYLSNRAVGSGYDVCFAIINALEPNSVTEGGRLEFETVTKTVSKKEYELIRETGLAFYDDALDRLYPILKCALPSVGKYLDATASFKKMTPVPIGSAFILAEKLSCEKKSLKCMYIKSFNNIRPIIGVGVTKTECGVFEKRIKNFFAALSKHGMYRLAEWHVDYERTLVKVVLNAGCYSCEIAFSTSNMIGDANIVQVGKTINGVFIPFSTISGYRTRGYDVNEALNDAITEALPAIMNYKRFWLSATETRYTLGEDTVAELSSVLGKKRSKDMVTEFYGTPASIIGQLTTMYGTKGLPPKQQKAVQSIIATVIREWN